MDTKKTIFRISKPNRYVILNKHLVEDARLSYEARGLLACMLAKPDNWVFNMSYFIKNSPAGRDKVRKIFKELIVHGYIVKTTHRSNKGRFTSPEYIVYESAITETNNNVPISPQPENPSTVTPSTDSPSPAKQPLLNKQLVPNNQVTNKTTTNREPFIWSKKISKAQKDSIFAMMENQPDQTAMQLLLDELAGQIDHIQNPVGYFRKLLNSHHSGDFIPAKALQIQAARNQKHQQHDAIKKAEKLHEERVNELLKRYEGKNPHQNQKPP